MNRIVLVLALALAGCPSGTGSDVSVAGSFAQGDLRIVSWNIENLGCSKSPEELDRMAALLADADLVAVQEVVTGSCGARAVANVDARLDRTGANWDYRLSDRTSGRASERYAFLWRTDRVRLAAGPWLEPSLEADLDREPALARFEPTALQGRSLLIATFHAVPRRRGPEAEVRRLAVLDRLYAADALVIAADFNLDTDDDAFDGLRRAGLEPVLDDQRTTIKQFRSETGEHLANELDNVLVESAAFVVVDAGVVDFTPGFATLREARSLSDHLPVYLDLVWR